MNTIVAFIIVFILLLIALIKFKISPPIGLFSAAILMGLLVGMPLTELLPKLASGFGNMMTSIGLLIIFGGLIGEMLGDSGGTEELAKGMLRTVGKKNDLLALNLVGFIISIPIYFGTAYIMLTPLVNALQKLSIKRMHGYVVAIFTGLLITHCCVAPTPGPLAVAGALNANLGWFIIYGVLVSLPASLLVGWAYAEKLGKDKELNQDDKEVIALLNNDELLKADPERPSASKALKLILFPIILILIGSIIPMIYKADNIITGIIKFLGNNNIALFIAVLVTAYTLKDYLVPKYGNSIMGFIDKASEKSGNILFIVGAGGSFAAILQGCGLGEDLVALMTSWNMPILILAFLLTALIRLAVGSATVAVLTAVAIVGPVALSLGYSPIIVGLALTLGSVAGTSPTDAIFWFPAKYNGLGTESLVKTTTLPSVMSAAVGFAVLMLLHSLANILPGMF